MAERNRLKTAVRYYPGVAVVDLDGEINAFAQAALNDAYAEATSGQPGALLLNFGTVQYINSTGIALIVSLLTRARQSQRRLLACCLSPHYVEIFQITRLAEYIPIYEDEAGALLAASDVAS